MATIENGRKLMTRATEQTMRHLPGFISASIHRSVDGAQPHMKAAAALASFEPIVCEVVDSIDTDR